MNEPEDIITLTFLIAITVFFIVLFLVNFKVGLVFAFLLTSLVLGTVSR